MYSFIIDMYNFIYIGDIHRGSKITQYAYISQPLYLSALHKTLRRKKTHIITRNLRMSVNAAHLL